MCPWLWLKLICPSTELHKTIITITKNFRIKENDLLTVLEHLRQLTTSVPNSTPEGGSVEHISHQEGAKTSTSVRHGETKKSVPIVPDSCLILLNEVSTVEGSGPNRTSTCDRAAGDRCYYHDCVCVCVRVCVSKNTCECVGPSLRPWGGQDFQFRRMKKRIKEDRELMREITSVTRQGGWGGARGVCGGMCVCVCIPDTATLLGTLSTKSTVGWRHVIWSWGYERINYVVCVWSLCVKCVCEVCVCAFYKWLVEPTVE